MAERLTRQKFIKNCDAELTPCKLCSFGCGDEDKAECWEMAVYNRLAAYEDLGTVEELAALRERTRWIPCSEQLPDKSGYYLIACDNPHRGRQNGIDVSYYQHKAQNWKAVYNPCVTHWMPLPEAPKEAANG